MARPREFDRDAALTSAMQVFWARGFAATSTDDLVQAMGIGRQSLYNAFGDKRALYLEALGAYQRRSIAGHIERLALPGLAGIEALLTGLVPADDRMRAMGCMGVGSVAEFGADDPELIEMRTKAAQPLHARLVQRLREGREAGEIDADLKPDDAAAFIQMAMTGIQLAARGGASPKDLRRLARFTVDRLKA